MKRTKSISMTNPWSGSTAKDMIWSEIRAWAKENLNKNDRPSWLATARRAYDRNDSDRLGVMIIGS